MCLPTWSNFLRTGFLHVTHPRVSWVVLRLPKHNSQPFLLIPILTFQQEPSAWHQKHSLPSIRVIGELPDDLPAAQLRTIKLRDLRDGSTSEATRLLDAAKEDGFFYLDLTDPDEVEFIDQVDRMFAMSRAIFDHDENIKLHFDIDQLGKLKLDG